MLAKSLLPRDHADLATYEKLDWMWRNKISRLLVCRVGGSIPAAAFMQKYLGITMTMFGFGLPSNNIHAPNERYPSPQTPFAIPFKNLCKEIFWGCSQHGLTQKDMLLIALSPSYTECLSALQNEVAEQQGLITCLSINVVQ